jgi:hypothetical protein
MGALGTGVSQEDFYGDDSLWGGYQFTSLADIITNFQLMFMGDNMQIPATMNRDIIIFHAKRGLQELNYDALKQIKAIEIDLNPDTLQITLPEDFINYVRVSWVDSAGFFHPMITNDDTKIAEAYLQDNDYAILFDVSGNVLKASQNSYDQTLIDDSYSSYLFFQSDTAGNPHEVDINLGNSRFGLETSKANFNGWFTMDKDTGVMKFSSNIGSKTIVLEYISDGLESSTLADIRVHKFAEEALYAHMEYAIVSRLSDIQEYVVNRKAKKAHIEKMKAKTRLNGLTYDDLFQVLRGRDKRIK